MQGLVAEGAEFGIGVNVSVNSSVISQVTIVSDAPSGIQVPVYIDKQREMRMPVIDYIVVSGEQAKQASIYVYGVYVHLSGR